MAFSIITSAVVAATVGFGGTVALVLAAATAVGASSGETSSWIASMCLATAVSSLVLSVRHRIPIVAAWSTPGAALIAASTPGIGMRAAVGAFALSSVLMLVTALVRPVSDLVARLPVPVAAAMLAGVLIRFVVAVLESARTAPWLVLPLLAIFLCVRLISPMGAILAVLISGIGIVMAVGGGAPLTIAFEVPVLTYIQPEMVPGVLLGLGLPLYLVTMASQNLPGFATLRAAGYSPPVGPALTATGAISALAGLACGHTVNMAAITAAICLGDDVHPDRTRRWQVGLAYGVVWIALGLSGPMVIALLAALPPGLVAAIVGIALLGPVTGALGTALARPEARFAAVVTLAVTASGLVAFGIGAAFWGLVAGLATLALETRGPVVRLASGARLRRAFLLSRRR